MRPFSLVLVLASGCFGSCDESASDSGSGGGGTTGSETSEGTDCTLTQGYWKNHEDAWPVGELTLGDRAYGQAALLDLLNEPVRGDVSLSLAHQLIAAKLNVANGADDSAIVPTLIAADEWLHTWDDGDGLPLSVSPASPQGMVATTLAADLDAYNNGDIGPGHCDDEDEDDDDEEEEDDRDDDCDGVDDDGDGRVDEGCWDTCTFDIDCLSVWQAEALGVLSVQSDASALGIVFTNSGPVDVCLDSSALYHSATSQAFFLDQDVLDDEVRLLPGESKTFFFGSYTTPNGYYSPYLGLYGWWCFQTSQAMAAYQPYSFHGEEVPWDLIAYVQHGTDTDGSTVDDRDQWWSNSVLSQANIWAYQDSRSVLTVGKTAATTPGAVTVTLTVRNIGRADGTGLVSDAIPSGWSWVSGDLPDTTTAEGDGTTSMTWGVAVAGFTSATTTGTFTQTFQYTMTRDIPVDRPYLELAAASIDYHDGVDWENNQSLPAAVFAYDHDGDGAIDCID